jgi:hypothetical protein
MLRPSTGDRKWNEWSTVPLFRETGQNGIKLGFVGMILAAKGLYNSTQTFSPVSHPTKTDRPEEGESSRGQFA